MPVEDYDALAAILKQQVADLQKDLYVDLSRQMFGQIPLQSPFTNVQSPFTNGTGTGNAGNGLSKDKDAVFPVELVTAGATNNNDPDDDEDYSEPVSVIITVGSRILRIQGMVQQLMEALVKQGVDVLLNPKSPWPRRIDRLFVFVGGVKKLAWGFDIRMRLGPRGGPNDDSQVTVIDKEGAVIYDGFYEDMEL